MNNNDDIFLKKIWRNCFIKNKILKFLKLYYTFYNQIFIEDDLKSFEKILYKKKLFDYLKSISFFCNPENTFSSFFQILSKTNIDSLEISGFTTNGIIKREYFDKNRQLKYLSLESVDNDNDDHVLDDLCNLIKLKIYDSKNQKWSLPQCSNLRSLSIYFYHELEDNSNKVFLISNIPDSVKSLKFYNAAHFPSFYKFPNQLKKLRVNGEIYYSSNEFFKHLPNSIEKLYLQNYDLPLPLLQELNFQSLTELDLGAAFDFKLEIGMLPNNLKKLIIHKDSPNIGKWIESRVLPLSLKTLKLGEGFQFDSLKSLTNLQKVECHRKLINLLPSSVKKYIYNHSYQSSIDLSLESLPSNFENIEFGHYMNSLNSNHIINTNIKSIKLGYNFNNTINILSLPSLTYLELGYLFNHELEANSLPQSLKYLKLSDSYDKKSFNPNVLPNSLISLSIGFVNNQILENLPSNLQVLEIKSFSKDTLSKLTTNQKIKYLIVCSVSELHDINEIPSSIENVFICDGLRIDKLVKYEIFNKLKFFKPENNIFKKLNKTLF